MNWQDISYLNSGSVIQQKAYLCLRRLHIFELLAEYKPILTGTIPIDISIDSSDLDIACKYEDADKFEIFVHALFGKQADFKIEQKKKDGYRIVLAKFFFQNFEVEIHGSLFPVASQNSYQHMLIEHRILKLLGDDFRQQIIQLKQEGLKTEPAFAHLLKIEENPYQSLLEFELYPDTKIIELWNQK